MVQKYFATKIPKQFCCSRQKRKIPRFGSIVFGNDLCFEEGFTKSELVQVLKVKLFQKEYFIDFIGCEYEVLRLLPCYCVFNHI